MAKQEIAIKDINGKALRREHYILLKDPGIEIVMYDLKTFPDDSKTEFGFEVHGSLLDSVDFDDLLEYLRLIKIASETSNPAIVEAMEHLKLVIGLANEQN